MIKGSISRYLPIGSRTIGSTPRLDGVVSEEYIYLKIPYARIAKLRENHNSLNTCTMLSSENATPPENSIPATSNRCARGVITPSDPKDNKIKIAIYYGMFEVDGAEIHSIAFVDKDSLMRLIYPADP